MTHPHPPPASPFSRLLGRLGGAPPVFVSFVAMAARLDQWLDMVSRVSGDPLRPIHAAARALALGLAESWGDAGTMAILPAGSRLPSVTVRAHTRNVLDLARLPPGSAPGSRPTSLVSELEVQGLLVAAALPRLPGLNPAVHLVVHPVEERAMAMDGAVIARHVLPMGLIGHPSSVDLEGLSLLAQGIQVRIEDPMALETSDQYSGCVEASDTSTEVELPEPQG